MRDFNNNSVVARLGTCPFLSHEINATLRSMSRCLHAEALVLLKTWQSNLKLEFRMNHFVLFGPLEHYRILFQ